MKRFLLVPCFLAAMTASSMAATCVPAYMQHRGTWWVSTIYVLPTTVLSIFSVRHLPGEGPRCTARAMARHALTGRKVRMARKHYRIEAASACTYRGNWVGAPCS